MSLSSLIAGDRMEDETLRAQTEPTPSVEQKPYISTSIVVDTEGEVVAISRNLELGGNTLDQFQQYVKHLN